MKSSLIWFYQWMKTVGWGGADFSSKGERTSKQRYSNMVWSAQAGELPAAGGAQAEAAHLLVGRLQCSGWGSCTRWGPEQRMSSSPLQPYEPVIAHWRPTVPSTCYTVPCASLLQSVHREGLLPGELKCSVGPIFIHWFFWFYFYRKNKPQCNVFLPTAELLECFVKNLGSGASQFHESGYLGQRLMHQDLMGHPGDPNAP